MWICGVCWWQNCKVKSAVWPCAIICSAWSPNLPAHLRLSGLIRHLPALSASTTNSSVSPCQIYVRAQEGQRLWKGCVVLCMGHWIDSPETLVLFLEMLFMCCVTFGVSLRCSALLLPLPGLCSLTANSLEQKFLLFLSFSFTQGWWNTKNISNWEKQNNINSFLVHGCYDFVHEDEL